MVVTWGEAKRLTVQRANNHTWLQIRDCLKVQGVSKQHRKHLKVEEIWRWFKIIKKWRFKGCTESTTWTKLVWQESQTRSPPYIHIHMFCICPLVFLVCVAFHESFTEQSPKHKYGNALDSHTQIILTREMQCWAYNCLNRTYWQNTHKTFFLT